MTPCANCGGALHVIGQEGGTESGEFAETWECANCGEVGTIAGNAGDAPPEWNRTGTVFKE